MPARELLNAFAKPLFLTLWLITWVIGHSLAAVAEDDRPRIVAFGDSLTAGLGVAAEEAYPARLQRRLDEQGLRYWVLKSRPDLVILELGGNDGLRGLNLDETKANLGRIIKRCQDASVTVILAGMKLPPNYGTEYTKGFEAIYPALAKQYRLTLIPFFLDGVAGSASLNQADGIHPTREGYRIIADKVLEAVKPLLNGRK